MAMTWLHRLVARGRTWLRREAIIDEIQQEMRSHVDLATEANLARGMDPVAARTIALREFGNFTRMIELAYDVRAGGRLEMMWQDLRFGVRTLFRNPGFAAVSILTLALGIGATAAIFSFVYGVVLRPLPYPEPDRLLSVAEHRNGLNMGLSAPDYLDWRAASTSFEQLAASAPITANLTGGGEPERLAAVRVSANHFDALGVRPALGRGFHWDDERDGAPRVVVLGDGLWRRRFAADPGLVGQSISINGDPHVVVGILPPQFSLRTTGAQLWLPLRLTARELQSPGARFLTVIGRLRHGVGAARAQAELVEIARRLETVRPHSNTSVSARVRSLHETVVGQVREPAFILLTAVGFVLLIACANVANLLLARATRRQAEMSIRASLGASRSRIARQLVVESAVIGLAGAVAGLAVAYGLSGILKTLLPADIPRLEQTRIDVVVLGFTLGISMAASLLFGVAPALRASRTELQRALRDQSRNSGGLRQRRLSAGIVATEIAMALVLLVAAGLLLRSFVRLDRVELGFDPANLMTARMTLPEARYGQAPQIAAFYLELATRLGRQAGVTAAAVASSIPLAGSGFDIAMTIEGRPQPDRVEDTPTVYPRLVSVGYFRTLGIQVTEGRDFSAADRTNTGPVAIVNETTARRHWPGQNPVGRRFKLDDDRETAVEIVGVVRDVKHFGLSRSPEPEVFIPLPQATPLHWQWLQRSMSAIARTSGAPEHATGAIRQVVRTLDDQLPLYNVRSMAQLRNDSFGDEWAGLALVGAFAAVALALASVGVYGVMAVMVAERSREIGIRLALGARPHDVRRMIMRDGAVLTAIGIVAGTLGAVVLTELMQALLFQTAPTDTVTFSTVAAVVAVAAMLACWVPARRSTRVDPAVALRAE